MSTDGALINVDVLSLLNHLKSGGGSIASVPEPASLEQIAAGALILVLAWNWANL